MFVCVPACEYPSVYLSVRARVRVRRDGYRNLKSEQSRAEMLKVLHPPFNLPPLRRKTSWRGPRRSGRVVFSVLCCSGLRQLCFVRLMFILWEPDSQSRMRLYLFRWKERLLRSLTEGIGVI